MPSGLPHAAARVAHCRSLLAADYPPEVAGRLAGLGRSVAYQIANGTYRVSATKRYRPRENVSRRCPGCGAMLDKELHRSIVAEYIELFGPTIAGIQTDRLCLTCLAREWLHRQAPDARQDRRIEWAAAEAFDADEIESSQFTDDELHRYHELRLRHETFSADEYDASLIHDRPAE